MRILSKNVQFLVVKFSVYLNKLSSVMLKADHIIFTSVIMEHLPDVPDYYKPLSLKLCRVLDDAGASVEVRNLMTQEYDAGEILETLICKPKFSAHVFGSAYEGTQTRGMESDVDSVYVNEDIPVVTKVREDLRRICLLLVQDQDTPAGYAKLQFVENGIPVTGAKPAHHNKSAFIPDEMYCVCVDKINRHVCMFDPPKDTLDGFAGRHGPALTQIKNKHVSDKDVLFAFKCQSMPDCVSEWFSRERRHNYPPETFKIACENMGCFFVPIGHPASDEKKIQWRMSFSDQERLLVTNFNSVQLKCFILLKLVKKEIIYHFMKQESLTSYHCKTCMLYVIENTPEDLWKPENLLACFISCLKLILLWAQVGICPNYFIPAENMFERRVYGEVQVKLVQTIQKLISSDCQYILYIQSDGIGQRFRNALNSLETFYNGFDFSAVQYRRMDLSYTRLDMVFRARNGLLQQICHKTGDAQVKSTKDTVYKLRKMIHGSMQTNEVVSSAISLVLAYMQIHQMSTIVATAFKKQESTPTIMNYLTCNFWHDISLRSDRLSSRLKQASHVYAFGDFQYSLQILSALDASKCFSFCFCDRKKPVRPFGPKFERSEFADISVEEHLRRHIVPCVVFHCAEKDIIPTPLNYELIRSEGLSSSRQKFHDHWTNFAVVDGIFMLHFLLYLNHSKLNMTEHARADITNMKHMVSRFKISHKETALNLLGWAFNEQGQADCAVDCFFKSLQIKPEHNAAQWHLRETAPHLLK